MEPQVLQVAMVQVEQVVLPEHQVPADHPVVRVVMELRAHQDLVELLEQVDQMVHQDQVVHQELRERAVHQDLLVVTVHQDLQDQVERPVQVEHRDQVVQMVHRVLRVLMVQVEHQEQVVLLVHRVLQDQVVIVYSHLRVQYGQQQTILRLRDLYKLPRY
jgi:hypothetical protein